MAVCTACGGALVEGDRFCAHCGSHAPDIPLTEMPVAAAVVAVSAPASASQVAYSSSASQPDYGPAQAVYAPPVSAPPDLRVPMAATSKRGRLRSRRNKALAAGLVFGVVAGILTGILTKGGEAPGEVVASAPVGPEGGSISFGDRGRIDIPPGALAEKTTITIRKATVDERTRVAAAGGQPPTVIPPGARDTFVFLPVDTRFLKPVTITLPLPDATVPGSMFVVVDDRMILIGGTADATNGLMQIETRDFLFRDARAGGAPQTQIIER